VQVSHCDIDFGYGYVYVMESGGYYKIGWSSRPKIRHANIQTSNPTPVRLVGVIAGSLLNEAEWHECFKHKNVRGEWFALTEEDVAHVLHESYGIDRLPGEFEVC
jgi:hypothetical protein